MLYDKLLEPITFANGTQSFNRIMMAPMCDDSSDNGYVTAGQLTYMRARAANAGIMVTGYAYVNDSGIQVAGQLSAAHDDRVAGLRELATAMKSKGARAILQLSHAGRDSGPSQAAGKRVYAPSKMDFPWLDYDVDEMTTTDIENVIHDFQAATQRAIDAGFDGVEIHDCHHDLLQQFFSAYSNHRNDQWGGSLERRMAFPLAVLKAVKETIATANKPDFILGWRISPEEVHGENVGYHVAEMVEQTKAAIAIGIDYLNVSLSGGLNYHFNEGPKGSKQTFAEIFHNLTAGHCPVFIGAHVHTADDALAAVTIADGTYIGRALLIDPNFTQKIKEGRSQDIITTITHQEMSHRDLPAGLIENYAHPDRFQKGIPLPGLTF
ncbi:oxidoreductase [Lactiplantibacillus pentosus]|jgi:2,4-dienoyl-CoA reductase-like NADH-dependent reductase (Old Yellow Enzyme family)|uniref:oxidoreductase n=1 Tax=Lactiplantibacillus pentosus TaxID=1589 RepID=UPI0017825A1C|nr:NADH-dependent oxidoreductase [Lactiplantibacillus pentosus]MCH4130533.1 NADH-dependent oxidoreductase [Lactiplantibacillus sp.]UXI96516.1 NADH-dependent oxidoreductase [Lactiplantibacillus pentosus]